MMTTKAALNRDVESMGRMVDVGELLGDDSNSPLAKAIRAADKNGDGKLSKSEFRLVFEREVASQQKIKYMKTTLVIAIVLALVVIGANVGLSVAVAKLSKDTDVSSDTGLMFAKGTQTTVATSGLVQVAELSTLFDEGAPPLAKLQDLTAYGSNETFYLKVTSAIASADNSTITITTATGHEAVMESSGIFTLTDPQGNVLISDAVTEGARRHLLATCRRRRHLLASCGGSSVKPPTTSAPGIIYCYRFNTRYVCG